MTPSSRRYGVTYIDKFIKLNIYKDVLTLPRLDFVEKWKNGVGQASRGQSDPLKLMQKLEN